MTKRSIKARTTDNFLKEKGFKLPLPTIVEGIDKSGKKFTEKTVLQYISPSGSSFWLNTLVSNGSELRLTIDLPPKLKENRDLKMIIKGKTIFVEEAVDESSKSRVSVHFENKYIIDEYK
ncbi:MAG: PilZ domain-containing protein [Candidatus Aminicenantes bacterium]|nr:PilZ domain-containing protein [Candidatus Aminicenantes bacterium]